MDSPYKFLSYYDYTTDDQNLFFGRERETQILLSDIVVRRLVVLFAKTGTGKTSLINAGVRPLLEKRGYTTYFVRVSEDPIASAREVLRNGDDTASSKESSLSTLLRAKAKEKPLVIFFDQFEEFFQIREGGRRKRQEFISQVAELNRDKSSRVHIVFSLREDFLYGMDQFRKDIPTIFRNDSNLRLLGLDETQARDAITKPAKTRNVTITDELIAKLIEDLSKNQETTPDEQDDGPAGDEIEIDPTQLQIVCDTLWQKKVKDLIWLLSEDKKISLTDYLGSEDNQIRGNTVRQILNQRLAEQFEGIKSDKDLKLLEKLLPKLRTRKGTKFVRGISELAQEMDVDESSLRPLLVQLEAWHVIRKSHREDSIELLHDYLVKSLNDLRRRVRTIIPRRLLETAIKSYGTAGEEMLPEDLAKISKSAGLMSFTPTETEFLFRAALANQIDMKVWFDRAERQGILVWNILSKKIETEDVVEALYVLDLLAEMKTAAAVDLLEKALKQPKLTSYVIQVLGQTKTPQAIRLLETELYGKFSNQAEDALTILSRNQKDGEISRAATRLLEKLAAERNSLRGSVEAITYRGEFESRTKGSPPYELLYQRLQKSQIIPFLGYGASLSNRNQDETWLSPASSLLPTSLELAGHLAEISGFPTENETLDLVKVAEYVELVIGRQRLNRQMHEVFDHDIPLASIHQFLADLDAPLLIVTTNYDDLVERAFRENGRDYDVVIHTTDPSLGDAVLWWPHGHSEPEEISPMRLDIDLTTRTVIYKMNGSVDRDDARRDQFAVTEDDHIEFLTRLSRNRAIPPMFAEPFQTRPFLFLGYYLRDWHVRVVLNRLGKEFRRHRGLKSWSIQMHPSPLERILWQAREVSIFDMELGRFVDEIRRERKTS